MTAPESVEDVSATFTDTLRWTDNHCHLHHRDATAQEIAASVSAARAAGVERMITVGCDVADSVAALAVTVDHPQVLATAGVHPHEAAGGIEGLEGLLAEPAVVAVGECGMDLFYEHSPRDIQREVFAAQVALAHSHDLALMIHTRDAWDDTFEILAAEGVPERTVFHCFSGGPAEARRCLDVGAMISFSGIITFKTAGDVRDAAALCPPDRMLVETDSPFLAPVPHRGKTNEPQWVPLVGEALAAAQGRSVEEVALLTWDNAGRTYRLGS